MELLKTDEQTEKQAANAKRREKRASETEEEKLARLAKRNQDRARMENKKTPFLPEEHANASDMRGKQCQLKEKSE